MIDLINTILNKNKNINKNIIIGFILSNKNNEILLIKNRIDRINKDFYDIPVININKKEEKEILKDVNFKYGINLKEISGYINEDIILDDECNNIIQVNVYANIDDKIDNKQFEYQWKKLDNVINSDMITDNLKNCIEIYKYNKYDIIL